MIDERPMAANRLQFGIDCQIVFAGLAAAKQTSAAHRHAQSPWFVWLSYSLMRWRPPVRLFWKVNIARGQGEMPAPTLVNKAAGAFSNCGCRCRDCCL